jgi:hypothetical protein
MQQAQNLLHVGQESFSLIQPTRHEEHHIPLQLLQPEGGLLGWTLQVCHRRQPPEAAEAFVEEMAEVTDEAAAKNGGSCKRFRLSPSLPRSGAEASVIPVQGILRRIGEEGWQRFRHNLLTPRVPDQALGLPCIHGKPSEGQGEHAVDTPEKR